jgi:succinate dehydrogenase hydrophobic anchor subunit
VKINTYAGAGMWSWVFQRITGLLLVVYFMVHMWGMHFRFEFKTPLDGVFTYVLSTEFFLIILVLIVYHGFNGICSVTIDLVGGIRLQRWLFWVFMVLGVLLLYAVSIRSRLF